MFRPSKSHLGCVWAGQSRRSSPYSVHRHASPTAPPRRPPPCREHAQLERCSPSSFWLHSAVVRAAQHDERLGRTGTTSPNSGACSCLPPIPKIVHVRRHLEARRGPFLTLACVLDKDSNRALQQLFSVSYTRSGQVLDFSNTSSRPLSPFRLRYLRAQKPPTMLSSPGHPLPEKQGAASSIAVADELHAV